MQAENGDSTDAADGAPGKDEAVTGEAARKGERIMAILTDPLNDISAEGGVVDSLLCAAEALAESIGSEYGIQEPAQQRLLNLQRVIGVARDRLHANMMLIDETHSRLLCPWRHA